MPPIAEWLNALGLGQYAQRFADNDIDTNVLPDLTEADLEKIGVSLGHRKRILRAIAELQETASSSEATRADAPQRRQLTVMFCDLVGSTPLSTRLDPEELRDIIGAFHRCCVEQIAKSDGVVARYMGDGMLVYFGYPQAHEDDAERAVRAGLALVAAVAQLVDGAGWLCRCGLASPLAWWWSAISSVKARRRNTRPSVRPPTLRRGCKGWPSRTPWSLMAIRAASWANSSSIAPSETCPSRGSAPQCPSGRSTGGAVSTAVSRPCARRGRRWWGAMRKPIC